MWIDENVLNFTNFAELILSHVIKATFVLMFTEHDSTVSVY